MTDFAKELFSSNVQPQSEQTDFASELFGTKAISGRQVGSGQFAPIEPEPKAISEPSRGASALTAFMGGIPTDKQAAVNYFAVALVNYNHNYKYNNYYNNCRINYVPQIDRNQPH